MSSIKRIVLGESTEAIIRTLFDNRAAQESNDGALNAASRALSIRDLKTQVLSFVKRNYNSKFELRVPEMNVSKSLILSFCNYPEEETSDEPTNQYTLNIDDNFDKCTVTQKVKIGRDIVLTISAK